MTQTPKPRAPRSERAESAMQVLILLAIGGCAAAASFTHVHNVAAAHGQPGWLAWADAVVLELMSIATGLEIRRRHRAGQPAGFVLWILCAAVALSLSAQVAEAEGSLIGWIAAALPALGFLACVKIVLTRNPATAPEPSGQPHSATSVAVESPASTVALAPVEPSTEKRPAVVPAELSRPMVTQLVPVSPGAFARVNGAQAGEVR